jgi:hypothetical protein
MTGRDVTKLCPNQWHGIPKWMPKSLHQCNSTPPHTVSSISCLCLVGPVNPNNKGPKHRSLHSNSDTGQDGAHTIPSLHLRTLEGVPRFMMKGGAAPHTTLKHTMTLPPWDPLSTANKDVNIGLATQTHIPGGQGSTPCWGYRYARP